MRSIFNRCQYMANTSWLLSVCSDTDQQTCPYRRTDNAYPRSCILYYSTTLRLLDLSQLCLSSPLFLFHNSVCLLLCSFSTHFICHSASLIRSVCLSFLCSLPLPLFHAVSLSLFLVSFSAYIPLRFCVSHSQSFFASFPLSFSYSLPLCYSDSDLLS